MDLLIHSHVRPEDASLYTKLPNIHLFFLSALIRASKHVLDIYYRQRGVRTCPLPLEATQQ